MNERKSITVFVDRYLPSSEAFIVAQAMAMRRYAPHFLAFGRQPSMLENIDRFPLLCWRDSVAGRVAEGLLKLPRVAPFGVPKALERPKLIHAHFGKNGYIASPLAKAWRIPLVTTYHGFDATFRGDPWKIGGFNQTRYFLNGRREMAKKRGWSIAVSSYVRDRLLDLGFSSDRIFKHYIGIDTALFRPQPSIMRHPNRVVCVSRFVAYKGHAHIVDALAKVAASGREIELCLVGSGPLKDQVVHSAKKVLGNVRVFDGLSQRDVRDLVASARLYVHGAVALPNGHAEALGVCNLEAQAVGTPVVAFDSGGVAEGVFSGKSGTVVPERNVAEMAAAIEALLRIDDQWKTFSANGPKLVQENFDIVKQTQHLEDYYSEVIGSRAE